MCSSIHPSIHVQGVQVLTITLHFLCVHCKYKFKALPPENEFVPLSKIQASLINQSINQYDRIFSDKLSRLFFPGSPCEHDGICVNTPGSYRCDCVAGFTGTRCEVNVNECESNPCQNEGTCIDERGGYRCICMPGKQATAFHLFSCIEFFYIYFHLRRASKMATLHAAAAG